MTDHKDHVHIKTSTKIEPDRVWVTDHNGVRVDYSHEQFMAAFQALPLPARMRAAAEVIDAARAEFRRRPENDNSTWLASAWNSVELNYFAWEWEREDAEKAREAQEVEELAKSLQRSRRVHYVDWENVEASAREFYYDMARAVLAAGYRKTDQ